MKGGFILRLWWSSVIIISCFVAGCASGDGDDDIHTLTGPDYYDGGFFVQVDTPDHAKTQDVFYYKSCSQTSPLTEFSKTSYECTKSPFGDQ